MKPVAVISGGSDGLGKEIARQLIGDYQVVILSPHAEKLQAAAAELGVDYRLCDVANWGQVDAAVRDILAKYQQINALINCAGVWIEGELDTNDPAQIKRVLEVNCLGTILLSRAVIPAIKAQKSGKIINIISDAGLKTKAQRSVYCASKWAITGFTKCLELDLSPYGISVSAVYPGPMKTKFFEKAGINRDLTDAADPVSVASEIAASLS
ncbi:MAG: SDR family oxidoreductase [Patescibacteria group bacterium]|nr:SDR family oxidoreductase [Patescibacteria group bacterium]MCL5432212.1 SDR family oxidoreductase [Patescibacteria group bacterium]